jgi:PAS domain-containing protein
VAVGINWHFDPLLKDPMHIVVFAIVLAGNFMINEQRMKFSQVSSDVSIQFKVISENARDAQIILDGQLRFVYINPAVDELTGYKMQDISKRSIKEVTSQEDYAEIEKVAAQRSSQ